MGQLLEPESKLYFQVMVSYEDCDVNSNIPKDERTLESAAIDGYERADEIANHTIAQIQTKFPKTKLIKLDLDQVTDGYHLVIMDGAGGKIVKVGVTYTDYTEETVH